MAKSILLENIFGELKRLFSNDLIIHRMPSGRLKVIDTYGTQTSNKYNTNYLNKTVSSLYSSRMTYSKYGYNYMLPMFVQRTMLFRDYELMDLDSIISSGMDLLSEECTTKNEFGNILKINTPDKKVADILHNLYYDILSIQFNLKHWIRNLVKYGDWFMRLEIAEDVGIMSAIPLSVYFVTRLEGTDLKNPRSVKFKVDSPEYMGELENFEVSHMRLLTDSNFVPYGKSMIEGARKTWKQLSLMEDAMLIHRIMRAPQKRIFKIDVGNLHPNEVDAYMEKIMSKIKKVPYIDNQTGDYNLQYNMENLTEDFYLPVRGSDSGTSIDTLSGLDYNTIEDIQYIRNKLMSALRIPKAFLGYDESIGGKCISPDTMIPLINGEEKTVKELIDDFNNNIKNYVYSYDFENKTIVSGEIEWAGYTRLNTDVIRITLDNEKFIDITHDHIFYTRDYKEIKASELSVNDSLLPLYFDKNKLGYTTVYQPNSEKYELVHQIIAKQFNIKKEDAVVHHRDFNKLNNIPENLDCSMNFFEHRKFHQINCEKTLNSKENIQKRINDKNWLLGASRGGKISGNKNKYKLVEWIKKNGAWNKGIGKNEIIKCLYCGDNIETPINSNRKFCNLSCSRRFNIKKINIIFSSPVIFNKLIKYSKSVKSFLDLENKLKKSNINWKRRRIFKILEFNNISHFDFIDKYMMLAKTNRGFYNNYLKEIEFIPEIKLNDLIKFANKFDSIGKLCKHFSVTRNKFDKLLKHYNIKLDSFINEHMSNCKFKALIKNHKVIKIEYLSNKIDTCDITIKKYHNFGTSAGIIIHNSTLSAEDVRFARTIENIQASVLEELTNLGILHLYTIGIRDERILNFNIKLTSPSTVYEQEKIEIWKQKIELANSIKEQKMLSTDWIYKNIYDFNDSDRDEEKTKIPDDAKLEYRYTKIAEEGNDPKNQPDKISTNDEVEEKKNSVGRPVNPNPLKYKTDDHYLGRDPGGNKANKNPYELDKKSGLDFKHGSPLSLETLETKNSISRLKDKLMRGNITSIIND